MARVKRNLAFQPIASGLKLPWKRSTPNGKTTGRKVLPLAAARFLPAIITLIIFSILIWWLIRFTNKRQALADYRRTLAPHVLMVAFAVIGLLILLLNLPFSDTTRGQVVTLVGVIITGIIAISSTTFVTNAMAGLMLRWIRNFKAGDFIEVKGLFGRITERGLFHTEIQNEEHDLITFPNLYLITNPTTVKGPEPAALPDATAKLLP